MQVTGTAIEPRPFLFAVKQSGLVPDKTIRHIAKKFGNGEKTTLEIAKFLVRKQLLTPFQATQILEGRSKGFFLGGYKILDVLGRGGMGATIYLAEHQMMGRKVALKVLPSQGISQKVLTRFYREARAIATVDHPNVVRAFDIAEYEGIHYLAMEYVQGESLHRFIHNHGIQSVKKTAEILMQVALGLQHIHEAGLVHRDIKPANLLITPLGQVKILDLGLVRFQENSPDNLTEEVETHRAMGTPEYMAPEQLDHFSEVDIRADLYSLGATAYYLLLGKPMFEGPIRNILISQQMHMPAPLSSQRMGIHPDFERIIKKLLAKKPEERYQTPIELHADLQQLTFSSDKVTSATNQTTLPHIQLSETVDIFDELDLIPTKLFHKNGHTLWKSRTFWAIVVGLNLACTIALLVYLFIKS